jgi:uncharacterized protein (TIGR02145 family)
MQRKRLLLVLMLIGFEFTLILGQVVKDIDGNVYATTTIGKQIWMAENLKTSKFNDGKPISLVSEGMKWNALKTPAYCWLNNKIENKEVYGALYNWYAVNTNKLCPKGWHVPSNSEWTALTTFLGDINFAGDKLKDSGTDFWTNSLSTGTNDFDFTALPGGTRLSDGSYPTFANSYAVWWSSTAFDGTRAWNRGLYFSSSKVFKGYESNRSGFSVRCLKDMQP